MIVVLGVGLVVVAVTLFGAVSQRRRDFGRRRALGASRSAVVALVLAQTFIAALLGGVVGLATGSFIVWRLVDALPSPSFTAGVLALSMLSALLAAVPPALIAARRDPVQILRVP